MQAPKVHLTHCQPLSSCWQGTQKCRANCSRNSLARHWNGNLLRVCRTSVQSSLSQFASILLSSAPLAASSPQMLNCQVEYMLARVSLCSSTPSRYSDAQRYGVRMLPSSVQSDSWKARVKTGV